MILGSGGQSFVAGVAGLRPVPGAVFLRLFGHSAIALMEMTPGETIRLPRELVDAAHVAIAADHPKP